MYKKIKINVFTVVVFSVFYYQMANAQMNDEPILKGNNLIANGDFMSKDPHLRPLRWIIGQELQTATLSDEQRHSSKADDNCLKVADTSLTLGVVVRSEKHIVNPGTKYIAKAWLKLGKGKPADFYLEFWDINNKKIGMETALSQKTESWQQQKIEKIAPDKSTHVTVSIGTSHSDIGVSFWDDVEMYYNVPYEREVGMGVRELFVDDYRLESITNAKSMVHPGKKSAPLILPTKPWEGSAVYIYGTVLKDQPRGSGYQMWYTTFLKNNYYLCYATSKDGITWEKPNLGIIEFKGSKNNNICKLGGGNLIYDPDDKNPNRRYKLMTVSPADSVKKTIAGYGVYFSKDGLNWTPYEGNPVITHRDVSNVAYDTIRKLFIASTKQLSNTSVTLGKLDRAAFISTSKDFINWTAPGEPGSDWTLAVEGDYVDDLAVMSKGGIEAQIYGMPVHPYEGIYIGMPWVFDLNSYFVRAGDGPISPQIAASRDLRHWNRSNRDPLIPLGKPGAWDGGAIYTSSNIQVSENEITLYYGGMSIPHGSSSTPQKLEARIAKATWRKDGFVSISNAGDYPGIITTKVIIFKGSQLKVNTKLNSGGTLKIEILDKSGNPIEGHKASQAKAITNDQFAKTVTWENGTSLAKLAGKEIKLRFYLDGGDLYSYWFDK